MDTMNTEKKAILVVSFGTSYKETRDKTIGAIETQIAAAYPDRQVRRAFTSGMILRVLEKRDGIHIDNVAQAMERLIADGVEELTVQPTHVINGEEYEKMLLQLAPYRERFRELRTGAPLLSSSEDYELVVKAVMDGLAESRGTAEGLGEGEALVLMGHGTEHHVDAAYAALDYRFKDMGCENVFVGTVEGYPAFEQVSKQVKRFGAKKVVLMPFMIVAGDHANNDMASDEEDSWKSLFEAQGYETECVLKGLGEFQAVRDIYLDHVKMAEPTGE